MDHGTNQLIDEVRPLMAGMATGSADALFEFLDRFRPELERTVAGMLVSLNRRDVARQREEVASLAVSAALVLFARAPGWRSDGALPWVWAYRSIRQQVVAELGHPICEVDAASLEQRSGGSDAHDGVIDLRDLARRNDVVAAWIAAVEQVANERDRAVHLEYQVQKHLGDPSPAITVGSLFELSPANVRQIDRRVRLRLADHRFGRREGTETLVGGGRR